MNKEKLSESERFAETTASIGEGLREFADCLMEDVMGGKPCKRMEKYRDANLSDSEILFQVMAEAILKKSEKKDG